MSCKKIHIVLSLQKIGLMKKLFTLLFLSVLLWSCNQSKTIENVNTKDTLSGKLNVFHAGSLAVPVKELVDSFKVMHPNVEILAEAAGSVECARKITELQKPCDMFLSADYKVIDKLLIPDYADWNMPFATNEMVIAFNPKSRKANEIDTANWLKILMSKDVVYGRSDPDADPCGYRTLLCLQLAEKYYKANAFYTSITKKDNQFIRPKEVDLLALLESGNIDYMFIYRSVAIQHGLKYISLPAEINLGSKQFAENYAKASVEIKGKKPGEIITQKGEPMIYGFCIPKNAVNKAAAQAFAEYLLSKGLQIMEKNGQPAIIKPGINNYNLLPEALKPFAVSKP